MPEYDVLILYSGGADSRLMLELASKLGLRIYCIFIDYEQLIKNDEFKKMESVCIKYNINYQRVHINNLQINSGLTGSGEKGKYDEVHEMYVPFRNTMFLSIACSIAENMSIPTIWVGPDWSDNLGEFPDCRQDYINKFNELIKFGGSQDIQIEAPLLGFTKENVIKLLDSFLISKTEYFSGYGDL